MMTGDAAALRKLRMPELEARLGLERLSANLREYLSTLDSALDTLSHGKEGLLARVPQWCLGHREIRLGISRDGRGVVVKLEPRPELEADQIRFEELESQDHLARLMLPWKPAFQVADLGRTPFVLFGPMMVTSMDDPFAAPRLDSPGVIAWGKLVEAEGTFGVEDGRKAAIDFWNNALAGFPQSGSFVAQAAAVFARLESSIRLKAFKERRIHRLLRDHASLLLPSFKRLFFEHELYCRGEVRKADFILQRDFGQPALLIELESPVHRVFRADGHLTSEATHAKGQIAEWIWFIEQEPPKDAQGEMGFLLGKKDRLVVIGRGLEHRDALLRESAATDTGLWTYDLLLQQAKERWNTIVAEQCRQLGRQPSTPF